MTERNHVYEVPLNRIHADHTSGTLQPLIDGIMNEEAT